MSLLRTRDVKVGAVLAFTGVDPTDGQASFLWGDPNTFSLSRGDMVQVLDIETRASTTWAKVLVAVVKGKCSGRTGHVSIDLGTRIQRSWQALTATGSMAAARLPPRASTPSPTPQSTPQGHTLRQDQLTMKRVKKS